MFTLSAEPLGAPRPPAAQELALAERPRAEARAGRSAAPRAAPSPSRRPSGCLPIRGMPARHPQNWSPAGFATPHPPYSYRPLGHPDPSAAHDESRAGRSGRTETGQLTEAAGLPASMMMMCSELGKPVPPDRAWTRSRLLMMSLWKTSTLTRYVLAALVVIVGKLWGLMPVLEASETSVLAVETPSRVGDHDHAGPPDWRIQLELRQRTAAVKLDRGSGVRPVVGDWSGPRLDCRGESACRRPVTGQDSNQRSVLARGQG